MRWNMQQYRLSGNLYTELRAQENKDFQLVMLNGEVVANRSSKASGLSSRTLIDGRWGFASHPEIAASSVERVLKASEKNALDLGRFREQKGHVPFSQVPGAQGSQDFSTQKTKLTPGELNDFLKKWEGLIHQKFPKLKNRTLSLTGQNFIKEIVNSEGARTFDHYARSFFIISLGMEGPSGPVEVTDYLGGLGEIEDHLNPANGGIDGLLDQKLETLYNHLEQKSRGVHAQAGFKEVILDSRIAGILAHEAVGHTVEADLVKGGSVAKEFMNQMVASPLVNMIDFAHSALGRTCPSPVFFDDEGTVAEDTILIKDGLLKSYMHSKETAAEFNVKPTGHSRAWAFNDEPLIRMRNTAILPGKDKIADMIASVEDGYYLMNHSNGQADSTSEFMFGTTLGYEIKQGKIGRAILDTTISGVAFDMLKTITMISDQMSWVGLGTCGKKQPMHVGMGGPAIKCQLHMGGK